MGASLSLFYFFGGYKIVNLGMNNLSERITINPDICSGKPCIRNMRWPVKVIVDLVDSGMSVDEIISDHPELENEDVLAALYYN